VLSYGEEDPIEVTDGPYAWFRGFVVGPVEGTEELVAVVLNVYGRRVPTLLRRDQLGPEEDDDGPGGVREPSGPTGPRGRQSASVELSHPYPGSS
jgi:hypothetical protein